jgi:hypothetical protein
VGNYLFIFTALCSGIMKHQQQHQEVMKNFVPYKSQLHKTVNLPLVSYENKTCLSHPEERIMGMFKTRVLRRIPAPKTNACNRRMKNRTLSSFIIYALHQILLG